MNVIDIWNFETYTEDIIAFLKEHAETIIRYHRIEQQTDDEVKRLREWSPRKPNPFADAYNRGIERLADLMESKTIRAFHYTRMVDFEVEDVLANGFMPRRRKTPFTLVGARPSPGQGGIADNSRR
ncbi:hypothetical protein HGG76_27230 [Ochrobactrum tritici]|uniref:Uncharacterized protein n=1 Tax=Brucella tritici TaxID=94626 RepID=A0A7X6JDM2_9HYPH|nr:hypothetical protein [Brucella tritici]